MVCVVSFWVLRASFFLFAFLWCLVEFLRLKDRSKSNTPYGIKEPAISSTAGNHTHNPQHAHPLRAHLPRGLDLPHERRVTATSSTHGLSSTTTPLHVDSGNLETSEPKASETLCARITSLRESRPQPRLRPALHALRALACATTAHVPSCARARARVGRACARAISCSCPCHLVLVLVCSCAPSRPSGGWLLRWLAASVAGRFGG